jgi:hypothetical protein
MKVRVYVMGNGMYEWREWVGDRRVKAGGFVAVGGGGRTGALRARSGFLAALGMTISFRICQRKAQAKAK